MLTISFFFIKYKAVPILLYWKSEPVLCSRRVLSDDPLLIILNMADRFLCSRGRLLAHLAQLLAASPSPLVLDVSLDAAWPPQPVESTTWAGLQAVLQKLVAAIESCLGQEVLEVDLPASCNLASLFGLLLGFPVVYWSHPSQVNKCTVLALI